MQKLGEMLGQGATAEVFDFGDGNVVKLVKPNLPSSIIDYESWVTRTVKDAGASAPAVKNFVEIDGRKGFVMERVDGRPLLALLLDGEIAADVCGSILGELSFALHTIPGAETGLRTFHDFAYPMLDQLSEHGHSRELIDKARILLSTLDLGDSICHGDLNPNNVLMTSDGPRIIDWISAMKGNPLVDVARIMVTMSVAIIPEELHPGMSKKAFWDMRRRFYTAFMKTYASLNDISQKNLQHDLEPWMTMMATLALDEGTREQQAWLESYIQKRLV